MKNNFDDCDRVRSWLRDIAFESYRNDKRKKNKKKGVDSCCIGKTLKTAVHCPVQQFTLSWLIHITPIWDSLVCFPMISAPSFTRTFARCLQSDSERDRFLTDRISHQICLRIRRRWRMETGTKANSDATSSPGNTRKEKTTAKEEWMLSESCTADSCETTAEVLTRPAAATAVVTSCVDNSCHVENPLSPLQLFGSSSESQGLDPCTFPRQRLLFSLIYLDINTTDYEGNEYDITTKTMFHNHHHHSNALVIIPPEEKREEKYSDEELEEEKGQGEVFDGGQWTAFVFEPLGCDSKNVWWWHTPAVRRSLIKFLERELSGCDRGKGKAPPLSVRILSNAFGKDFIMEGKSKSKIHHRLRTGPQRLAERWLQPGVDPEGYCSAWSLLFLALTASRCSRSYSGHSSNVVVMRPTVCFSIIFSICRTLSRIPAQARRKLIRNFARRLHSIITDSSGLVLKSVARYAAGMPTDSPGSSDGGYSIYSACVSPFIVDSMTKKKRGDNGHLSTLLHSTNRLVSAVQAVESQLLPYNT